ncbi:hypothetical protein SLEP1_g33108 [Rubroshorea leprosula]|uniref:Receptor-like serine/threonine-protein kinase n=1 Tax=Rubroshorea leprosula TaxID=152421 RepID=A0AAV5KFK7_9ROSI|nr:hypothetical protein SLEP1_g33108 [Rubroshorea leprosula]
MIVAGGLRNTTGYFLALLIILLLLMNGEITSDYLSSAKAPISWINNNPNSSWNSEEFTLQPIFVNDNDEPSAVCGFYCKVEDNNTCLFAISIFISGGSSYPISKMVWSANRNNPVGRGAKLQLSQQEGLTLQDGDNTLVWSTNTSGKSVLDLTLTGEGNLQLFDGNNETVWQSFDHPTDSLVFGKTLVSGQKLVANASLLYYQSSNSQSRNQTGQFYYAKFGSDNFGTLSFPGTEVHTASIVFTVLQLEYDGHLRAFWWTGSDWKEAYDLFEDRLDSCSYPLVCGEYGICSAVGPCSCPDAAKNGSTYFRQINSSQQNFTCSPYNPISCKSPNQSLLEVKDVDFALPNFGRGNYHQADIESCKQGCLKNCSCKYALFIHEHDSNSSSPGQCFLRSEALSFKRVNTSYNQSSLFLKVQSLQRAQIPPLQDSPKKGRRQNIGVILGSTLGASLIVLLIICILSFLKSKKDPKEQQAWRGGFGCVFQGTLPGGAQIAVKCLDGFGPVRKSFIAEVETIGSIHHFNLVRLFGFCAEKSNMLLAYEYMCNGSLDQWIFHTDKALVLGWQCRRKIILDIAKGLAYLHEGCRQKIIHLDIKPQNILLDENFNAKVSDFGLSKLVGREQSQVVTTMRGTPGYMAPEWLNSVITEKVDVYSFGIVVLETLCGRKNVDRSLPEEDTHLCNEEMQSNATEVVEMMKVAAWCLQGEYASRPSMSIVVKFLEGKMDDENEYDFSEPPAPAEVETFGHQTDTAALIPSVLSGPR